MVPKWMRLAAFLAFLPLVTVACDDSGPTTTSESAQLTVLLTDAPGQHVDNVWVEIGEIYLQRDDDDMDGDGEMDDDGDMDGDGDPDASGREVLFTAEEGDELGLVNLLDLADATLTLAEDVELPAGTYGQLRFVVESGVLEAGGKFYNLNGAVPPTWDEEEQGEFSPDGALNCPSCQQSGLKALLPQGDFSLGAGQQILVLDFDVSRSFGQQAGRSGMWVMRPVIVATELGFSSSITGTVTLGTDVSIPMCPADDPDADPPVEGQEWDITVFQATATAQTLVDDEDEPLVYTDSPNEDGELSFGFLEPDGYAMGFTSPLEVTDTHQLVFEATVEPGSVDVSSGDVGTVSYTIDSATCEEIPDTDGGSGS
ncbi:MAG: DUF4382 domain-containing protein [Gemmatimonadota bacterium]